MFYHCFSKLLLSKFKFFMDWGAFSALGSTGMLREAVGEGSGMLWGALGRTEELRRGLGGYGKLWETLWSSGRLWVALGVSWVIFESLKK